MQDKGDPALRYISTRGRAPELGFADAMLAGLATDGGLYVPSQCPLLSGEDIANMANQQYLEIAWRVIAPFVGGDIPVQELTRMLQASYRNFDTPVVAPLRMIEENLHVMELFHGPTFAFKDVALQFLGQVFDYVLKQRGQRVTIVGATSGDTGSAAIDAFAGRDNADIFILHPKGRISEVQRRQMTTVMSPNVHNIAIEGSFDDCQDIVKALFHDGAFRDEVSLSAINSINWARILAQVVYYVYAGAKLHARTGKPITFAVPTGNFGNIYAGYVAKSMGLPVARLIAATNSNDILFRFFATGRMKKDEVVSTLSPSMDIQVASNFERLLFDMCGRQGSAVEQTMRHFRENGPFQIEESVMAQTRKVFASGRLDDTQTKAVIKDIYDKTGYILDPHTAVGVGIAQQYMQKYPESVTVCMATAHPAKFPEAVRDAIGIDPPMPPALAALHDKRENYATLPADVAQVMGFVRERRRA